MTTPDTPAPTPTATAAPEQRRGRAVPLPRPRLVFAIPGPDEPGFIRRQRTVVQLTGELGTGGLAAMDRLIDFLVQFVAEPADPAEARELLLDLSRTEYMRLLDAVKRENPDFLS